MEGQFSPNPRVSIEKNLENFEHKLKKEREYKKIAIGIFAPFYPIFWLADLPKIKQELQEGKEKIRQQLADPDYLLDWENKEAQKGVQKAQDKIKEFRLVIKDLENSSPKTKKKDQEEKEKEEWEIKRDELQKKIMAERSKAIFFHQYKENLSLLKKIQKTDQDSDSKPLTKDEAIELISTLIYGQKLEDFKSDKKAELPLLSEKISAYEEITQIEEMTSKIKEMKGKYDTYLTKES